MAKPLVGISEERFPYFDGWRGLAILFLLVGHFLPVPGINFGTVGVNFFFVLSGWFMSRLLFEKNTPLPLFYRRRISRVFPALGVFIVAITLIYMASGRPIAWKEVIAATLLLNNYITPGSGITVMPLGHIWSLSVEEHSYVLLAAIAFLVRKKGLNPQVLVGVIALACALFGVTYSLFHPEQDLVHGTWLHTEVAAFGIFFSSFLFLHGKTLFSLRRTAPLVPIIACVGVMLHWWSMPLLVKTFLGIGALAVAVNLLPLAPEVVKAVLSFSPLRQLGVWSFSIYVWQQPFYYLLHREGLSVWLALPGALLAGVASFYLVENPIRAYLNTNWGPKVN